MEQQAREQAFISALTTEQFVLQAARSANVGEMTGRGTVYMGAVSSSLIAFGFLAQVVTRLDPFVGDPEGEKRSVTEIDADEVAPSLRWATARPERAERSRNGERGAERGHFDDPPPTY